MTTVYFILVLLGPILAYEFFSLQANVWTISKAFRYLGQEWSLFTPYALGTLLGHFYVQPPSYLTLAGYVGEVEEVVIVLWIGWAVYVVDKGVDPSLPWWGYLLFCIWAMLVGGFCWTLGV